MNADDIAMRSGSAAILFFGALSAISALATVVLSLVTAA